MVFYAMQWIIVCFALQGVAAKLYSLGDSFHYQHDVDNDLKNITLRPNQYFHFQINCIHFTKLFAIDAVTKKTVEGIKISKDGKIASGYVDDNATGTQRICFRNKLFICKCITLDIKYVLHGRQRRDIADVQFSINCGASSIVTEGVLLLNTDYRNLSNAQKSQIVAKIYNYVNVEKRNILILENRGSFYRTGLENPRFISFGLGDAKDAKTDTTVVKFLASCDALAGTDSRITKFKTEGPSGQISNHLGYPLISWYFITGTLIPLTTTSLPR